MEYKAKNDIYEICAQRDHDAKRKYTRLVLSIAKYLIRYTFLKNPTNPYSAVETYLDFSQFL